MALSTKFILQNRLTGEYKITDAPIHDTNARRQKIWGIHRRIVKHMSEVVVFDSQNNVVSRERRGAATALECYLMPPKPLKYDPVLTGSHKRVQAQRRALGADTPKIKSKGRATATSKFLDELF